MTIEQRLDAVNEQQEAIDQHGQADGVSGPDVGVPDWIRGRMAAGDLTRESEMGISSDGIVAFGIDLGEELPASLTNPNDDDEAEFDLDTWVYGRMGVGYDTEATWEHRRKAIDSFPFDLITHCSYDYPMYFLAARGTEVRAKRGFPVEFNPEKSSPEKINAMRKFCEEFGIEWKDPSWKVFSVLG